MTHPNKNIPSYLQLNAIVRVLLKLLFISVVLTIASGMCAISYPLLERSARDAAVLVAGFPDKPPPFDDFLKKKRNEKSQKKNKTETSLPEKPSSFELRITFASDHEEYDSLMAEHYREKRRWLEARNRWQMSVVFGFLGLSGLLFSLVLIGFAVLAIRSSKFPILRPTQ